MEPKCYDCDAPALVRVVQQNQDYPDRCYNQIHCIPCARDTGGGTIIPLPGFWESGRLDEEPMEIEGEYPTVVDLYEAAERVGEIAHLSFSLWQGSRRLCGGVLFIGRDTMICVEPYGTEHDHSAIQTIKTVPVRRLDPKQLKTYRVGSVYEFQAENEEHAAEQYESAMADLPSGEINYIREV